jgi:hypothetical protein
MPDRAVKQVSVRRPAQIPGLVYGSRHVLSCIDRLTAFSAARDLVLHTVHASAKFFLVVKRGHHDMPPFPSLRVITVVTDYETLDAVIFGIYARHNSTVTSPSRIIIWKLCQGYEATRTRSGMTGRCLGELERILRRSFQVEADAACSSNELENARRAVVGISTAVRAW